MSLWKPELAISELSPEKLRLECPPGKVECKTIRKDLRKLVDQVKRAVPAALQSEEFAARTNSITKRSVEERDKILNELNDVAKESSYAVRMNQLGIGIVPIRAGKAISQEEYDSLPPSTKKKFEQSRETVRNALDKAGKQVNE